MKLELGLYFWPPLPEFVGMGATIVGGPHISILIRMINPVSYISFTLFEF